MIWLVEAGWLVWNSMPGYMASLAKHISSANLAKLTSLKFKRIYAETSVYIKPLRAQLTLYPGPISSIFPIKIRVSCTVLTWGGLCFGGLLIHLASQFDLPTPTTLSVSWECVGALKHPKATCSVRLCYWAPALCNFLLLQRQTKHCFVMWLTNLLDYKTKQWFKFTSLLALSLFLPFLPAPFSILCTWLCLCLSVGFFLLASTDAPISKPTPLYGQPSWWGEDEDPANKKESRGGKFPEKESPGQWICLIFLHAITVNSFHLVYAFRSVCLYKQNVFYISDLIAFIGYSHVWELDLKLPFLWHLMFFVGHWEVDGVKPKAGPWLSVVDW